MILKRKCKHNWAITEVSNVLQLDSMGYPLRLCIEKCEKCGKSRHIWLDVHEIAANELSTGESVLCVWTKIGG